MILSTFALAFFCGTVAVIGADNTFTIHNISEFIQFSNNVNNGKMYTGSTVFLDSDIYFTDELSNKFDIIGDDWSNYFNGAFDGKGHVISNLHIDKSLQYTGLFGCSYGITIKNLVMDSSCSVTNSYGSSSYIHTGAIISCCATNDGICNIQSVVNMASVTFKGTSSSELLLGGIVGHGEALTNTVTISNCANYGTVSFTGKTGYSYIGGIVGSVNYNKEKYIQNCVNYGEVIHNGTSSSGIKLGGIVGETVSSVINVVNCVNIGKFATNKESTYIASIVGGDTASTTITHSFWTGEDNYNKASGSGKAKVTDAYAVETNITTVNALSEYNATWNNWVYNPENKTASIYINENLMLNITSQIILLPDLNETSPFSFDGWYTDPYYTEKFEASEIAEDTVIYGLYGSIVTIGFDYGYGDSSSSAPTPKKVVADGSFGVLPEPMRTGYTFDGWFIEETGERINSDTIVSSTKRQTIVAQWTANNYTVSFDVNGGDSLDEPSKEFTFDGTYDGLPEPTRTGYTFDGWFIDDNERITSDSIVSISANKTFTAQWTANNYTVSFDVNGGDSLDEPSKEFTFDGTYDGLPEPTRTRYTFDGWFIEDTDEKIESDSTVFITENKNFTAKWTVNKYVLSLDFGNGTVANVSVEYETEIECPENVVREGYTFNGWDMSGATKMPAYDFIIKAQWFANKYTVSFDVNGGDSLDETSKGFTFDGTYEGLPEPSRTGYTFDGWFTEENERITVESTVSIPNNQTLHAQWKINNYTLTFIFGNGANPEERIFSFNETIEYPKDLAREGYVFNGWNVSNLDNMPAENITVSAQWVEATFYVKVVLGTADLTKSEVTELLKKHTKAEFTIERFETDNSAGSTVIIVKFNDPEEANSFTEKLKTEIKSGEDSYLRDASLDYGNISLSHCLQPIIGLLYFLIFYTF